ncbi:hypothetical protein PAL_GLEAN10003371 [Pteropus alecto]|uniref:Uncharacterized protein n=1 Tax=Pteropus alecto TaxID=9402 RepID=L5K4U2_PTEAL|nr:hypothetical protein PAL_GLEAN10003371 [Pteropus alecto]
MPVPALTVQIAEMLMPCLGFGFIPKACDSISSPSFLSFWWLNILINELPDISGCLDSIEESQCFFSCLHKTTDADDFHVGKAPPPPSHTFLPPPAHSEAEAALTGLYLSPCRKQWHATIPRVLVSLLSTPSKCHPLRSYV